MDFGVFVSREWGFLSHLRDCAACYLILVAQFWHHNVFSSPTRTSVSFSFTLLMTFYELYSSWFYFSSQGERKLNDWFQNFKRSFNTLCIRLFYVFFFLFFKFFYIHKICRELCNDIQRPTLWLFFPVQSFPCPSVDCINMRWAHWILAPIVRVHLIGSQMQGVMSVLQK